MKFIKIVSLLLAVIMTAAGLAACGEQQSSQSEQQADLKIWWAYNTENYMQGVKYDVDRDSTLRFHGLKGDVESMQLMVTTQKSVTSFDLVMEDITSADGAVISADCFEVYAERYIEVLSSYNPDSFFGFYPDALVPMDNYKFRCHNYIDAGDNQGIWVNVNIPKDAAPGLYTGQAVLTLDEQTYNIPVELTVYNVDMPEECHAVTTFLIWYSLIQNGEGYASDELNETYYWFHINKRVTPAKPNPKYTRDPETYVNYIAEVMAEHPMITSYNLIYDTYKVDGVNHLDKDSVLEILNLLADKNIELRQNGNDTIDLFRKAMFYLGNICDEPSGADEFALVRESDLIITECKFEVAEKLNDYPDLKESLLSLRHLVTSAYNEDLLGSDTKGGVQTWCPNFRQFQTEERRQLYNARRNTQDRLMGENIWWYGCMNPKVPYPTYHLDDDLITSRVLSWMQYDYGIEGNLYWVTNDYNVGRDVWTNPEVETACPGDGYLIYPGREYGINGPISTLRLESIREGNEDYEYFWLFEQKIRQYNQEKGTNLDTNTILQTYFAGLYDGVMPARDSDAFYEKRVALLKMLEMLYTDTEAAIASLG